MGTGVEAVAIPAIISAIGAGAQVYAGREAAKEQDEAAAQGIRVQAGKQREADARVAQEVQNLENSTPEDSRRQATDAFMQQLKRTRAQSQGSDQVGAVSDEYTSGSTQANTDISKFGADRAGLLGRINAPGLQRQAETVSMGRANTDLGLIKRAAAGDQFLTQLRQQSIRANPWLVAGGQVLGGVGQGMASWNGTQVTPGTEPLDPVGVHRVQMGGRRVQPTPGFGRGDA